MGNTAAAGGGKKRALTYTCADVMPYVHGLINHDPSLRNNNKTKKDFPNNMPEIWMAHWGFAKALTGERRG